MMRLSSLIVMSSLALSGCSWLFEPSKRPENALIKGINYVGVSVSDIESATSHYQDAFDLTVIYEGEFGNEQVVKTLSKQPQAHVKTKLLRSSNAQLRLMEFSDFSAEALLVPHVGPNGPGFAHVAVQAIDETQTYQKFLKGGAKHIGSKEMVQLNAANPVYYAYAYDADNIMFEVEHVDITQLELDTPPKNTHRLRHVALATPDFDRLVAFYAHLLEQESPRRLGRFIPMSGEKFDSVSGFTDTVLKMAFFDVRNMELEIAQYVSHPTSLPEYPRPIEAYGYNMIVFDVENISAVRERLIAAGGTVAAEVQAMDGGEILYGRDIDGNLLGFQKLDATAMFSAKNFDGNGT